eukprot:TRINITY_DN9022_c0_g1_i1.p1 TRINITY_DN9022_c0_g1~~TRINITY_DN9022_c0_g1_i1.p1  ORF type:complete len:645 (-),score=200.41 TRINITY_DN9022_c0_g1_i1:161-2095(-)
MRNSSSKALTYKHTIVPLSMLHLCTVFTKGGLVLWNRQNEIVRGASPIDAFIQQVLLQDKAGALKSFNFGEYILKWTFHNELNLIFVALYANFGPLFDIDAFLLDVKEAFVYLFKDAFKIVGNSTLPKIVKFDEFDGRFDEVEGRYKEMLRNGIRQQNSHKNSHKVKGAGVGSGKARNSAGESKEEKKGDSDHDADVEGESGNASEEVTPEDASKKRVPDRKSVEEKLKAKAKIKGKGKGNKTGGVEKSNKTQEEPEKVGKGKKPKSGRIWDPVAANAAAAGSPKELDKSKVVEGEDVVVETVVIEKRESEDENESEDDDVEEEKESGIVLDVPKQSTGLFGMFTGFFTSRALSKDDLQKPLDNIRQNLLAKNVASEIADKIVAGVSDNLVGKTIPAFTTFKSVVRAAMEETLTRILTPKRNIDVVREVMEAKREGRPYSIVFVGVNGVGKSTSLAKICYYLLAREFKVSIAACDTFRSGAVEQLKTHAQRLGVEVFQQGYNKDASAVAAEGIKQAARRGDDVVLIDTAGRMQGNEPLMRALAKLIDQNNPDLVLFVGEALVGNDAVDQLVSFNRALTDHSTSSEPRIIDGLVLTKFDTVDDKVGSAISMTYTTGQPIVFVGVGQDYGDIRRLSVKTLVHKLLK